MRGVRAFFLHSASLGTHPRMKPVTSFSAWKLPSVEATVAGCSSQAVTLVHRLKLDDGSPGLMAPPMELDIGLTREEMGEKSRMASSVLFGGGSCQRFFFGFGGGSKEWPEPLDSLVKLLRRSVFTLAAAGAGSTQLARLMLDDPLRNGKWDADHAPSASH
nr:uncharacterized protein LOC129383102 [Dermacentor andersoni]